MPNWCDNVVTIKHKNEEAIKRVVDAFKKGKLCNQFIPIPEGLNDERLSTYGGDDTNDKLRDEAKEKYGYPSWYEFCVHEWGTKWDVGGDDGHVDNEHKLNCGMTVQLTFTSAWSPPIGLYNALIKDGYNVTAYYFESGMGFCGKYSEEGDEHYNLSGDEVSGDIPADIDDAFSITETYQMWREEEELNK